MRASGGCDLLAELGILEDEGISLNSQRESQVILNKTAY
jgi:hypothetical protein